MRNDARGRFRTGVYSSSSSPMPLLESRSSPAVSRSRDATWTLARLWLRRGVTASACCRLGVLCLDGAGDDFARRFPPATYCNLTSLVSFSKHALNCGPCGVRTRFGEARPTAYGEISGLERFDVACVAGPGSDIERRHFGRRTRDRRPVERAPFFNLRAGHVELGLQVVLEADQDRQVVADVHETGKPADLVRRGSRVLLQQLVLECGAKDAIDGGADDL